MLRRKVWINLQCDMCGKEQEFVPWLAKRNCEKRGTWRCKSCAAKSLHKMYSADDKERLLAALHAGRAAWWKENPDKASEIGKKARESVKISGAEMRQLQKDFYDKNEEAYAAYCSKRRRIALNFHASLTDDEKAAHYQKVFASNGKGTSQAEEDFFEDLESVGLFFKRSVAINGFYVDGLHEETNTILEFYGDSHHCHPSKFTDPSRYCSWIGRTVQQQWDRDKMRIAVFYKHGYSFLSVWQSDWTHQREVEIRRIKEALSKANLTTTLATCKNVENVIT